nr:hypothetical protein [Tanacetum cinerariifolium]
YDSLRLSQAQILWGLYHKKNVDFAYLLWEDFVYQVGHKDIKKSNEMYYLKFTKVIIHYFMSKDPSIPRRNKGVLDRYATFPFNTPDFDNMFLIVHIEPYGVMMNRGSFPEFLHVNLWNICCDQKCLVERSQSQNIIRQLKSGFLGRDVQFKAKVAFPNP